jgi:DNA anti-recombination protein RmuC
MHKLIILFLLVGSLVMLLPFGTSINIISKAMAFNIVPSMNNDDEQDYLQRYEKFYKDDSFREDYYNYHKQHHKHNHHQQQIEKEVPESIDQELQQQQNSITESLPQQNKQQQGPLIITQEQMHQQQIEKLKQLLESIR